MRRSLFIGIAAILFLALVAFSTTYTVRFTDAAVKTRFGKADAGDVHKDPGLYWKLPYPFESVTTYDTRVRIVQQRPEMLQTNDSRQLIIEAFCTWRVADPLVFFQRFSNAGARAEDHYDSARQTLEGNLRSAMSELSRYRMSDLFPKSGTPSKLPELEAAILAALRQGAQGKGIEAVSVGINRIKFPEETTKAVFQRMESDRKRLVDQLESQGQAEAQTIKTAARSLAMTISDFSDALAKGIRARGDAEAAPWLEKMTEHPGLAVFLRELDFLRTAGARRTTLVLPTTTPGIRLVAPDATDGLKAGELPGGFDEKKVHGIETGSVDGQEGGQ